MPEDLPSSNPMKSPSLSRRIYNSSLTLALSFSFYALLLICTLSCEGEEATTLPLPQSPEEVTQQGIPADSIAADPSEAVSYVEKIIE